MNIKKFLAYFTVYAFVVISVPFFFNSMWLKDFPQLKTYDGTLEFSSARAYEDLKYITVNFPKRTVGSQNAESSANWISQEFKELGLETNTEEFTCMTPEKVMNVVEPKETDDGEKAGTNETDDEAAVEITADTFNINSLTMNGMYKKVRGLNVIGVSKGKSDEIIILGAHRDTYGTIEGAQDNASGTVSMLELARVLTKEEHYYTYMFISFDGEEIGLKGSEAFAQKHSLKNVKLAMILDCVGYKGADTAGLYQFASARGASPLWTTALANKLTKSKGMEAYYLDVEGGFDSSNLGIFNTLMNKMVSQRVGGDVNTDTGPFVDRNIPAVGFIAANSNKRVDPENIFHTGNDIISNVSEDTLEFIGKLSEQFVKSVELNDFSFELENNMYLITGSKYLDFRVIAGFMAVMILACIMLWFISSIGALRNRRAFLAFLKSELPWIISITALSAFSGFLWQILNYDFAADINILILILLWVGGSFLGLVVIIAIRFIALRGKRDNYHEITKYQRILLNCLYSLLFLAVTIYFNVFVAMILVGTPLLVMGRVGYKNTMTRIAWGVVLVAWFIFQTILLLTCLESYIFDFLSMKASILLFAYSLLVAFTFVYVISTPLMPKKFKYKA
ncbi:M28 family metallopeptidase [Acetivibrio cellulolyticus]|uniref:M28 family metallopeptidase n=1 Tax=Acetivibrio cellulolyticus TaxID=35830 RepID=UPI0001E2DEC5|nr:M28 family peptidase [Acetivibrio cellulolyticus]